MHIGISNIRFITDEPKTGQDRLLAVFAVSLTTPFVDPGVLYYGSPPQGTITVDGFRYYAAQGSQGYVTVPSIKTKNATVRPVSISPAMKAEILKSFLEAWGALPRPESVNP